LPEKHANAIISTYKLFVISEASWERVKIDWNDFNQVKYYPWAVMSSARSASGFSFHDYARVLGLSGVGSRLVYPDREIAEFVFNENIELYRDLMVIPE
jgi:hypothetical protein